MTYIYIMPLFAEALNSCTAYTHVANSLTRLCKLFLFFIYIKAKIEKNKIITQKMTKNTEKFNNPIWRSQNNFDTKVPQGQQTVVERSALLDSGTWSFDFLW